MKERTIKVIMSVAFVFLIFVCYGADLYYRESLTFSETMNILQKIFGNILIVSSFSLIVVIVFSLIYTRLFKNRNKSKN